MELKDREELASHECSLLTLPPMEGSFSELYAEPVVTGVGEP